MISEEAKRVFARMREDPANRSCIECGAANPQWASGYARVAFIIIISDELCFVSIVWYAVLLRMLWRPPRAGGAYQVGDLISNLIYTC